jgi:phospholipase C
VTLSTRLRRGGLAAAAAAATAAGIAVFQLQPSAAAPPIDRSAHTTSPIKHVVVIFDENVSYDHYFGTYPTAANSDGTPFMARPGTPANNNLVTSGALKNNPNTYAPTRLTSAQALTCDQNHAYLPEQKAVDAGKMDKFAQNVSVDTCTGNLYKTPGLAMDYYDGNTTTALWNYAQYFSMSDNSWDTTFGPSTPGALNLISGQTHGVTSHNPTTGAQTATPDAYTVISPNASGVGTVTNDPDPLYDDCSDKNHTATNALAAMSGKNVGDLLNAQGVTWGWFQGGFRPTTAYAGTGTYAVCGATHANIGGSSSVDYSPHHSPFEYYASTSNPHHLPPSSVAAIGRTDQANHNYDLTDFNAALGANNLPAVSFLKAAEYQDGHAGYSDPADEQNFLVSEINAIQKSPDWKSTAVVIAYDDSDGWYDHVAPTILNGSSDTAVNAAVCTNPAGNTPAGTSTIAGGYLDRCGPSQRLPLLVLSPYAKANYIDHSYTDQTSILTFIENNWSLGRIGDSSFDTRTAGLDGLFNFHNVDPRWVLLNGNGSVQAVRGNLNP